MKNMFNTLARLLCSSLLSFAVATALLSGALLSAAYADETEQVAQLVIENQVNTNTADAETLALSLDGVGMTRALDIIAYREEHGSFKTVDELERVRGIGKATLERNRSRILLDDDNPQ